jgi:glutamyl-tRNA synthetase
VTVEAEELDDFVILRSDGTPTYNFCVVIDDHDMEISHVIRGKDHLNNTFRQLYVYEAFDWEPPEFAHLPLISGLSKRIGSKSVQDYRREGFLPEAINNYLARLGWSHGDQEIFSMEELIEYFDLDQVSRSSGEFDHEKLTWVNSEWMKRLEADELAARWIPYLEEAGLEAEVDDRTVGIVEAMHQRAKTLVEMTEKSSYFFADEIDRNDEDVDEWLTGDIEELFADMTDALESTDQWDNDTIDDIVRGICDEYGEGLGAVAQPARVALTGGTSSPGLFTTIELMGQQKTVERMNEALEIIRNRD